MEPTVELNISSLFAADHYTRTGEVDDQSVDELADDYVDVEDDCMNLQMVSSSECSDDTDSSSSNLTIEYTTLERRQQSETSTVPRSILKRAKSLSHNDTAVVECLSLLSSVPHKTELLFSVGKVFKNLCIDHFFNGDCINSLCRDVHYPTPAIDSYLNEHQSAAVWNSGLFIIQYSDHPDIVILKSMIKYFAQKKDRSKTLAFAKCFSKVKTSQASTLAQHLVTSLASFMDEHDAVTTVLYLAAAQIDHKLMDSLMRCLGVFYKSYKYSELLQYLNSLSHVMGYMHLLEITRAVVTHKVKDEGLISAVLGFLNRLNELDLNKVKMEAIPFFEKFDYRLTERNAFNQKSIAVVPKKKRKLEFGKVVIAEFSTQSALENEAIPSTLPTVDAIPTTCCDGVQALKIEARLEKRIEAVVEVFEKLCHNHLLSGQCFETTCQQQHKVEDFTLKHFDLEKAKCAADFYIDRSTSPSLAVLEVFLNYFIENGDESQLLSFARCTLKLSPHDSAQLCRWVLSALVHSKNNSYLKALEKMLMPEIPLGIESEMSPTSPTFYFDSAFLQEVIDEVAATCSFLPQFMIDEINRRIENLPQEETQRMATSIDKFFEKFVTPSTQGKFHIADILPVDNIEITDFRSQLGASLRSGSTNKYFVGTMMLKLAVNHEWRDEAADVLYEFMLNSRCRQIVDGMLQNCRFIYPESVRFSAKLIICNVAISCCLRLYESGDKEESLAIFNELRQHRTSLHDLEPYLYSVPQTTLALVCCNLYVLEGLYAEAVDMFLQNVLVPYLEEVECAPSMKQIDETIGKLIITFSKSNSIDPIIKLFDGIFSKVKNQDSLLGEKVNIFYFSEITLRCCFVHHSLEKVRESCLKLYFCLSSTYPQLSFRRVTYRSLLLTAVNQTDSTCRLAMQLVPNLLSSPIKKLLIQCIKSGAYPKLSPSCRQFELYSSMTFDEIRVYVIWWMFKYLETRKKKRVNYYHETTVTVVQDCVLDDSWYPMNYRIQRVDNSITGCVTRLIAVLKKLVPFPIHHSQIIQKKKSGAYQLPWYIMPALSRTVVQCLNLYDYTNVKNAYLCSTCFDKDDIIVKFISR